MSIKPLLLSFTLLGAVIAAPGPFPGHGNGKDKCAKFDVEKLSLREVGSRNTLDWRMWLELNGEPISFWHDVPAYPDADNTQVVNFVVEIPRWNDAKLEIHRKEYLNPIFHDDKDDNPRFKESVWPHRAMPFLYGSIPQTWESPNFKHELTNAEGDKDPIDLFDISQDPGYVGQVKQVKLLGGLAVVDDGESDWKMLGIDVKDPLAPSVNSPEDVEKWRPGTIQAFYNWFGLGGVPIIGETYQNVTFTIHTVEQSHGFWKDLVNGKADPGSIKFDQTSDSKLKSYINCDEATKKFKIPKKSNVKKPAEKPAKYNGFFYYTAEGEEIEPGL